MFLICKMGMVVVVVDLIDTNKHIKYLEKHLVSATKSLLLSFC